METIDKLNNVLGWLSAMAFDKPELSNELENPLNDLSEAISEVENLSLSGVSQQRELLIAVFEKMNQPQITMLEIGDYDKLADELLSNL